MRCDSSGRLPGDRERRLLAAEGQAERRRLDAWQRRRPAPAARATKRLRLSSVSYFAGGSGTPTTSTRSASMPASTFCSDEERAHGQPGAHQQHDRERDLDRPPAGCGCGCPAAPAPVLRPALQRLGDVGLRRLQRRRQAEHDAGQHRRRRARRAAPVVLIVDPRLVRDVELRHQRRRSERIAPKANRTPSAAADERQQHALGQQLPHQPPAAGADRHPDRHLAGARRAAGELQVGDVGAGDQQQERDRAEQQVQAGAHLAARDGDVEVVAQARGEALRRERRRLLGRELRLTARRAAASATASVTPGASRTIGAMNGRSVRVGDSGSQNPSLPYQPNRGGMTPTMVCGTAVQAQRPAERRRAALEQPQPQPVAQHDDRLGLAVGPDVRRLDGAADDRRHAEEVEGVARQQHAAEALRRELAGQQHRLASTSPSRPRRPAPRDSARSSSSV